MPFDIEGARKAGYSDAEIADHLGSERGFDVAGARKSGYDDTEIVKHLSMRAMPKSKVDQIPGMSPESNPTPVKPSFLTNLFGTGEAALSAGTGAIAGLAGQLAGVGRSLTSGKFGTDAGIRSGEETSRATQEALTYRPRTEAGQSLVERISGLVDASKLAPAPIPGMSAAGLVGPSARQLAGKLPSLPTRESTPIVGMGSAMTDLERIRYERAQALPVPLPLTKGMLSRDFEQQRFEKETAKLGAVGEPLRERHAELNERILKNFDAFVDQSGAEAGGLRAVGQIVNDAIVSKAKMAKGRIDAAYAKARESGDMAQPVDISPIRQYVESRRPEAINAPIISSLEAKINAIASKNGTATINDLEEVRKMIVNLSGKDATNAHFGKEIKGLIDGLTENAGGADYKRARSLRLNYAKEFEDVGVIDKLMSTKPGTRDRAVAYEDVFRHSIMSGSLDDVRAVRKTLQTAGPGGMQAWRELQGQTVQHIKDLITKSSSPDTRGNTPVSAAQLSRVITELDGDGKLDFIFGKRGGQQMRDISQAAKDVLTFPAGSVNTSGTASVLLDALGSAATGRLPMAASQAISAIKRMRQSSAMKRRVADALAPPPNE